jgi:hypothetical protein
MKHRFAVVVAICACAALFLISTAQTMAQKAPAKYTGTITVLDKNLKIFTMQQKTAGIQIKYNDKTKFTYKGKAASADQLKQGLRVVVLVDTSQTKEMMAQQIDLRDAK